MVRLTLNCLILAIVIIYVSAFRNTGPFQRSVVPQSENALQVGNAEYMLASTDSNASTESVGSTALNNELDIPDELSESLSVVTDNTLQIHRREMPAYWKLMKKSGELGYKEIKRVAIPVRRLNEYFKSPSAFRGEPVAMQVNVRRVTRYEVSGTGENNRREVFEVWGSTPEVRSRPYVFVTSKLPAGLPIGEAVQSEAVFAGYFFKLQAYHSQVAIKDDRPLTAPLFIGEFQTVDSRGRSAEPGKSKNSFIWIFVVVVLAPFVIIRSWYTYFAKKRSKVRRSSRSTTRSLVSEDQVISIIDEGKPGD